MSSSSSSGLVGSGLIVLIVVLVLGLAYTVLNIVAVVKIIRKAGYSGAWFLILFVPVVGTIMFYVFAFSKWPVQRRLEAAMMNNPPPTGPDGLYGPYGWSRGGGGGPPGGPQGPMGGPQGPPPPQGWSPPPQKPPAPYIPPWN
jgi:hypothetical protein